jgi:hypothetical protein
MSVADMTAEAELLSPMAKEELEAAPRPHCTPPLTGICRNSS